MIFRFLVMYIRGRDIGLGIGTFIGHYPVKNGYHICYCSFTDRRWNLVGRKQPWQTQMVNDKL